MAELQELNQNGANRHTVEGQKLGADAVMKLSPLKAVVRIYFFHSNNEALGSTRYNASGQRDSSSEASYVRQQNTSFLTPKWVLDNILVSRR